MVHRVADCRRIPFTAIADERGELRFMECGTHLPFEVRRVFFIHNLRPGVTRGHHAHRVCEFVLMAVVGEIEVTLFDGNEHKTLRLNGLEEGLHLQPGIWVTFAAITDGAILGALASARYCEADYLRELGDYLAWRRGKALV